MKIYTKTGDDGSTGLIGGKRISKADFRIDCYGTVDELNATIGLAMVSAGDRELIEMLAQVQNELFVLGSHLAAPDEASAGGLPQLRDASIQRLETEIDAAESQLPPLKQFILPGGSECAARLHVARTVCRRAERMIVKLGQDQSAPGLVITYLNRLSDWLFVQARRANQQAGVADVPWEK